MDEIQRFTAAKEKLDNLEKDKIRIEERYKNERAKLEALVKEITDKGYDPTKLSETKEIKQAELNKALTEIETATTEIEKALTAIETETQGTANV
jgi:chromosome condensin MukBEF ATPase and DNA-binding subunit MukB